MTFKDYEDQKAFELWAFGYNPTTGDIKDMNAFNSRHGDKVWLTPDELISDSIKKMYALYVEESKGAIQ
jgi:hypothetical protein